MEPHVTVKVAGRPKGTGRLFALDTRDGDYLARMVVPEGYQRRKRRTWPAPGVSDQGPEGSCTGWGTAAVFWAKPRQRRYVSLNGKRTKLDPVAIYHGARQHDEWEGDQYEGSSVRGACEFVKHAGLISEYRWSFTVEDLLTAIDLWGPAVIGIDWPPGMRNPKAVTTLRGRTRTVARFTGPAGDMGHCLAVVGYDEPAGYSDLKNSHGAHYGDNGRVLLPLEDLEAALRAAGEAATLIET
jgi:hypothetical protein